MCEDRDTAVSPPTARGTSILPVMHLPPVFGLCLCRKLCSKPITKWQNMHHRRIQQNITLCYIRVASVSYSISEMMTQSCVSGTHHCPGKHCCDTADHSDKLRGKLVEMHPGEKVSHCGE